MFGANNYNNNTSSDGSVSDISSDTTTIETAESVFYSSSSPGAPGGPPAGIYKADDDWPPFEIFRIIFLTILLLLSTFGNSAVLWASGRQLMNQRYSRLHMLLISLAVSDLLSGFFQVAPNITESILRSWDLGESICKIHALTRSMFANISVSTLAIITIERYLNVESIDGNANLLVYACAVVAVWVFQAALSSPMAVWTKVIALGPINSCTIPFSKLRSVSDYTLAVRVVAFFCPLLILWVGNLGVIYKLRRVDRKIIPLATGVVTATRKQRSRKVTLTCLMLAIVFTVNLTPFQVTLLFLQLGSSEVAAGALNALTYTWLFTVFNICMNPFIYGIFFQNLKERLRKLLSRACQRGPDLSSFQGRKTHEINGTQRSGLPTSPGTAHTTVDSTLKVLPLTPRCDNHLTLPQHTTKAITLEVREMQMGGGDSGQTTTNSCLQTGSNSEV